jgi:hypothetical protein
MNPSEEQARFLQTVEQGHNVVGDCVAGAGKTTTVLMLAKRLPEKRILQMTYNSQLKSEVRQKAADADLKNLEVHTYHSLVVRYYDRQGFDDTVMRKVIQTNKSPLTTMPPCDILVLDEAQDMTPLYFRLIQKLLVDMKRYVQLVVLGDRYQGIYKFKEADPRYLTLCSSVWGRPFLPVSLTTSYRVTNQVATFVNKMMLGYDRIKAAKEGPAVRYFRCNSFSIHKKMAALLEGMVGQQQTITDFLFGSWAADQQALTSIAPAKRSQPLTPEDIFVLAPSLRSSNGESPLRKLENALVAAHIPCYFPTSDEGKLEEDVIKGKVVFSTFHQAKGRERRVVLIYGFDASYFKYYGTDYDPDVCPETLYVAATRAKEELILLEDSSKGPLPFLAPITSQPWLEVTDLVTNKKTSGGQTTLVAKPKPKQSKSSIPNTKEIHHTVSVTELTRFLKDTTMANLAGIAEAVFEVEVEPHYSVAIPSKLACQQADGESYEDVAEINGIVIPAIFEARLCGKATIEVDVRNEFVDLCEKESYAFLRTACQKLPPQIKTIKDFLYLGVLYVSVTEKLFHKLEQITSFQWLNKHMINTCLEVLEGELDAETVFEQRVEHVCETYPEWGSIRIQGRMDAVTDETVWEFKCTECLTLEHKLQLILYAYLWNQVFLEEYGPRTFRLLNLRTGERLCLDTTSPLLEEALKLMLENKYSKQEVQDDQTFLATCGSLTGMRTSPPEILLEE